MTSNYESVQAVIPGRLRSFCSPRRTTVGDPRTAVQEAPTRNGGGNSAHDAPVLRTLGLSPLHYSCVIAAK